MTVGNKIRVLIVDDSREFRENIRKLLQFEADFFVVGVARNGREGIQLARETKPHVVLMDIAMPEMNGIQATAIIREEMPETAVIILSVQSDTDYLRRAMLAGAKDYLIKPPSGDELNDSIRRWGISSQQKESKRHNGQQLDKTQSKNSDEGAATLPRNNERDTSPSQIRVQLVDDSVEFLNNIRKLLQFEDDIVIIGTARTGREAVKVAKKMRPNVILMDINMPDMDGITATELIVKHDLSVQVIILSVQSDSDYFRRAMIAGARDFLNKPPSGDELIGTIRRSYEISKSRIALEVMWATSGMDALTTVTRGKIIAVYSAKGGVGCTTIAVNLAVALHTEESKVALVDCNLQFGDVGTAMGLQSKHSVVEIFDKAVKLDVEFLTRVAATHETGVKVFLAPDRPEQADVVTAGQTKTALEFLRYHFSYIIVDMASSLTDIALSVFDVSDRIVLVVTPDASPVKKARIFLELAEALNYPEDKILIVLNRVNKNFIAQQTAVQDILKHKIAGQIAVDEQLVQESLNNGVPLLVSNHDSLTARGILALAQTVDEELGDRDKKFIESLSLIQFQEKSLRIAELHQKLDLYSSNFIQGLLIDELDRLAAGIAHDMRSPLNIILSILETIDHNKYDAYSEYLHRIRRRSHYCRWIADNFLGISLNEKETIGKIFLGKVVSESLELLQGKFSLLPDIHVNIPDETLVYGDANLLRIAFMNLVSNAIEAMPDGGTLQFEVQKTETHMKLLVKDTGNGILEHEKSNLFQLGFSTKPAHSGAGLYVARRVMRQQLGDAIFVQADTADIGSTFAMIIPKTPVKLLGSEELLEMDWTINDLEKQLQDIRSRSVSDEQKQEVSVEFKKLTSVSAYNLYNELAVIEATVKELVARVSDDNLIQTLGKIIKNCSYSRLLTRNLLEVSETPEPKYRPVSLIEVIEDVLSLLERKMPPDLYEVEWDIDPTLEDIEADDLQLKQVFMNLTRNALDAMPNGGVIKYRVARKGETALIEVTDSGVGILPENLPRLFTLGFTTKPKGYGIGLYSIETIISRHGGKIETSSRLGKGTTFSLWLPIARNKGKTIHE